MKVYNWDFCSIIHSYNKFSKDKLYEIIYSSHFLNLNLKGYTIKL